MGKWREEPPGSGRWRLNLYAHGTSHKLTFRGTKKEAELYEAQQRIDLGAALPTANKSVPVFESYCVEVYQPAAKIALRPSTWSVRRYQLQTLVLHFGKLKLTKIRKIREPEIEVFKLARIGEGASKETVNTELNVLSAALTYAREVLRLPCAKPRMKRFKTKKKKGKVQFYTRDEVGFILAACAKVAPRFVPLFTFLFETGCRKSEAINLPWKNVLFDQKIVRIWSETDEDDEESPGHDDEESYEVKSREREVPLSDRVLGMLRELKLKGLSREWVFPVVTDRMETKGERYAGFPNNTWDRVLVRATLMAREAAQKAHAPPPPPRAIKGGPHRARHTFASHFLQAKPDLYLLGRLLGHSNSRVTELYAHLVPGHLAEARNMVTFAPAPTTPTAKKGRATTGDGPRKPSLDRPQRARGSR
jgi:integrase